MKLRSFARAVSGALVCVSFVLTTALQSAETDLGALRAKAEGGNAIAQYNLGLAYLEGRQVPKDVIEAYVWLALAAENGATGKALKTLTPELSADQLSVADVRLADRRSAISTHLLAQSAIGAPGAVQAPRVVRTSEIAPPAVSPAPPDPAPVAVDAADADRAAELTKEVVALKADNTKLTAKILSVWKDLDSAKVEQAAADQRADRAEAATSQRAKEISVLQTERDQLRQQLAVALAAAKPASPASGSDAPAKALAAAEEARTKTASELETVRRDLAAARAAQADLKAQITKLSDENASLKSKGSAGRDAVRDVSAARAQVERDAAELKTLRTRITELSAENQRLELEAGKLADTGRRLEQAQSSVARLQGEIAELQSKIAALAPEGSAEELARLKQELARAKQAVDMTVRSYALVRQENDQLKARLDKIQQAVGAVQDAASKPAPAPAAARP